MTLATPFAIALLIGTLLLYLSLRGLDKKHYLFNGRLSYTDAPVGLFEPTVRTE